MHIRNAFEPVLAIGLALAAFAQAPSPPKPVPAKKAAAAPVAKPAAAAAQPAGLVDKLIRMIKLKMPDATIVQAAGNAGSKFTADDLIRLKEAGASDGLLTALTGQASSPAATSAPAAPASAAAPAAPSAPIFNSDLNALNCQVPSGQRKRVIAVRNFDYGTVKSTGQAVLNTQNDIGKGMTALAVKRIQEAGKYRVVERENVQTILAEQDFGATARVKKGSQARIGNILGADAVLLGTITVFGRDDQKKQVGGFGGALGHGLGGVKVKWGEDKAVVAVTYRLVDAETSEMLSSGEARGESKRKSRGVDLGALTGSGVGAGKVDMTSANFQQTIIGEATIDCMDKLMAVLNGNEGKIKLRNIDVDTRVAEIAGPQVYLSSGASDGIQRCDRFTINRIVKELRDPATKELLDLQVERVGDLVITEVRDRVAIGLFNGTAAPQIGYVARKVVPPAQ